MTLFIQENEEMLGLMVDNAVLNLKASTNSTSQSSSDDGGEIVLKPDLYGQYFLTAEINGQEVFFLVDTGAGSVALNQSDAVAVGFPIHEMEYSGTAWTANGNAKYAPVMLDEIHVGDYVINNVRGSIMGSPMKHSLLGMSFLQRLSSFEVKNNRLYLRW